MTPLYLNHLVGAVVISAFCLFVVWWIWYDRFRRWNCAGCGKVMRGNTDPLTGYMVGSKCGECCGWRRITQAEYNRSFGLPSSAVHNNDLAIINKRTGAAHKIELVKPAAKSPAGKTFPTET